MNSLAKIGVLTELLSRLVQDKTMGINKTQLQKHTYFLKEAGVGLGLEFAMHQFGPFSFRLQSLIDVMDKMGIWSVTPDPQGYGVHIRPGEAANLVLQEVEATISEYDTEIDRVVGGFGSLNTAELELRATIHFLHRFFERRQEPLDENILISRVHELKPRFNKENIARALCELDQEGWLS